MAEFIWIGSTIGAALGLTHGIHLFRRIAARPAGGHGPGGPAQGLYYALWAFLLWTVFGAYVLALWLLGVLLYPVVRTLRGSRPAA